MTNPLARLLTLAERDTTTETRAKWRNAHRARVIRGQYQDGAMLDMARMTQRSKETLYKWAGAADLYSSLVRAVFSEIAPADRHFAWEILRRATVRLSPWFFATLYSYWKREENLWNCLQDLAEAVETGWSIGEFSAHLKSARGASLTPLQQAEKQLTASLELLQNITGDGEAEQHARFKGALMGKIRTLNGEKDARGQWALLRAFMLME